MESSTCRNKPAESSKGNVEEACNEPWSLHNMATGSEKEKTVKSESGRTGGRYLCGSQPSSLLSPLLMLLPRSGQQNSPTLRRRVTACRI
eukprot:CAMPEP_0183546988 /NCGR_PEP_ID=MMETSP0371-20130417/56472_1 /TAXON_ID=268820 /ORGANISM="Peridinium aciculiferum, Strain PAER-2" /LENGTH=89 /DNA_ID=CAMNT_0025749763 /DNA_START=1 /DNA_END=267 /DNA_ORIENTATION=-